jgi:hypothetical protein
MLETGDSARGNLAEVMESYGRGIRRAARLSSCAPTVAPIWASSPAAWTAVVTISVPRGGPLGRPSGSGGGTRLGAGFGPGAMRFVGLTLACAAFGFAAFFAGFAGLAAVVVDVRRVVARRSPPMRLGRVERRLPRTLGSEARFADFFAFFFADFWVTRSEAGSEFPELALRRATVNTRSGRCPL